MQGLVAHRGWIEATVALTFVLALTWGMLHFGAAETAALYRLFLWLLFPAMLALATMWLQRQGRWSQLGVGLVGLFLLGQVAIQPTLEARGYLHLAVGWMAFWLTLSLIRGGERQTRFLIGALILLGAFEAFYGLAQSVGGFDYIGDYFRGSGRVATGTLINRNHFAALLNLVLPMALGLLFANQAAKRSQRARRSESLAKTWIVLLGCSVMGVAVLMSQSRGGTISLLMTLLFMAFLLSLTRRRISGRGLSGAAAGVLIFLVLGMGMAFGLEALLERFGRLEENLSRVELYDNTLDMIGKEWILGVGPGMYRWRFPMYQTVDTDRLYDHAHNDYLESAAEWGVLWALIGWGAVFWRFYRSAACALSVRDPWRQGLAMGCAGALFSILTHSLVDFSLQIPSILMVFAVILALSWAVDTGHDRVTAPIGRTPQALLHLLLLVAFLAAGWRTLQRGRALESARPVNGVTGLERAVVIDPQAPEPHYLLGMAYRDLPGVGDLDSAASELEAAVRLNPFAVRYWHEYSRIQELMGEADQAEALLRVAVELDPANGRSRWQLANQLLRRGDDEGAVEEMVAAVEADPRLVEPAVNLLLKFGSGSEVVETLLPEERAALIRLLRSRIAATARVNPDSAVPESTSDAILETLWTRLVDSPVPLTLDEGRLYVDDLCRRGLYREARQAWLQLMNVTGFSDAAFETGSNLIWNGDFELELVGRPFGWQAVRSEAFRVQRSPRGGTSGSGALEVEFHGRENINFAHVSQRLMLEQGASYRLTLALRAEELTTDEGVYVEVVAKSPNQVLIATPPVLGSTDWVFSEVAFFVPEGSGLSEIRLRRRPSQQIDSRIRGKVWMDLVGIEQVSP